MRDVSTVLLPACLTPSDVHGRLVVVFDVLRATTSINTSLANGASEVRVFGSLDSARVAAAAFEGDKILAGEERCIAPRDFDLGNSPCEFTVPRVHGRTIFFSTTNGTRALVAARAAQGLFAGSIVNAAAVAEALWNWSYPITLLCAGTNGKIAPEDVMGAGYVISELAKFGVLKLDENSKAALNQTPKTDTDRHNALMQTDGARNLTAAGLDRDIASCAALNSINVFAACDTQNMILRIARL